MVMPKGAGEGGEAEAEAEAEAAEAVRGRIIAVSFQLEVA